MRQRADATTRDRRQSHANAMHAFSEVGTLDGFAVGDMLLVGSGPGTVALFMLDTGLPATEAWCLRCVVA